MEEHPILVYYKDTLKYNFPLILFVGREPNTENILNSKIDKFDFDDHPRCAFWNTAFGVVGYFEELNIREVKNKFRETKYSNIIFTDSLPKGIKNEIKDKYKIRELINDKEIEKHIENLSKLEILDRVNLIVLCGLEHKKFQYSVKLLKKLSVNKNIPIVETKFLIGNNKQKIIEDLKIYKELITKK